MFPIATLPSYEYFSDVTGILIWTEPIPQSISVYSVKMPLIFTFPIPHRIELTEDFIPESSKFPALTSSIVLAEVKLSLSERSWPAPRFIFKFSRTVSAGKVIKNRGHQWLFESWLKKRFPGIFRLFSIIKVPAWLISHLKFSELIPRVSTWKSFPLRKKTFPTPIEIPRFLTLSFSKKKDFFSLDWLSSFCLASKNSSSSDSAFSAEFFFAGTHENFSIIAFASSSGFPNSWKTFSSSSASSKYDE